MAFTAHPFPIRKRLIVSISFSFSFQTLNSFSNSLSTSISSHEERVEGNGKWREWWVQWGEWLKWRNQFISTKTMRGMSEHNTKQMSASILLTCKGVGISTPVITKLMVGFCCHTFCTVLENRIIGTELMHIKHYWIQCFQRYNRLSSDIIFRFKSSGMSHLRLNSSNNRKIVFLYRDFIQ